MEKLYSLIPLELTAQGETLDHHNDAILVWMNLLPVPCKFSWHGFLPVYDEEHNIILYIQHLPDKLDKLTYESTLSIQNHRLYLSWEPWLAFAFFILPCSWIYVRAPKSCCLQPRTFNVSKLTKAHLVYLHLCTTTIQIEDW
jgi:hypothetical protein